MNGPFSVFLVHLHYHSLGTLLTLEYLDASQEKDWKTIAKRVVSASQDMALDPPLVLKGGDRLKATCHYNSVNRTTATLFGFVMRLQIYRGNVQCLFDVFWKIEYTGLLGECW